MKTRAKSTSTADVVCVCCGHRHTKPAGQLPGEHCGWCAGHLLADWQHPEPTGRDRA